MEDEGLLLLHFHHQIVTDGKGQDMDGFGKTLSKEQIKGLVDFYRGLAK